MRSRKPLTLSPGLLASRWGSSSPAAFPSGVKFLGKGRGVAASEVEELYPRRAVTSPAEALFLLASPVHCSWGQGCSPFPRHPAPVDGAHLCCHLQLGSELEGTRLKAQGPGAGGTGGSSPFGPGVQALHPAQAGWGPSVPRVLALLRGGVCGLTRILVPHPGIWEGAPFVSYSLRASTPRHPHPGRDRRGWLDRQQVWPLGTEVPLGAAAALLHRRKKNVPKPAQSKKSIRKCDNPRKKCHNLWEGVARGALFPPPDPTQNPSYGLHPTIWLVGEPQPGSSKGGQSS